MISLDIRITQNDKASPGFFFVASCNSLSAVGDTIYVGYGKNPYCALRDLIDEFENQEVWRADNE
jgi:hypothetical protein